MKIEGSIALVTGANGGIGHALVEELLKRGASKIYVGTRDPGSVETLIRRSIPSDGPSARRHEP